MGSILWPQVKDSLLHSLIHSFNKYLWNPSICQALNLMLEFPILCQVALEWYFPGASSLIVCSSSGPGCSFFEGLWLHAYLSSTSWNSTLGLSPVPPAWLETEIIQSSQKRYSSPHDNKRGYFGIDIYYVLDIVLDTWQFISNAYSANHCFGPKDTTGKKTKILPERSLCSLTILGMTQQGTEKQRGPESVSNLPQTTQLLSVRAGIWT